MVCASNPDSEAAAQKWLKEHVAGKTDRKEAAQMLLECWWTLMRGKNFGDDLPSQSERHEGWRNDLKERDRVVELGWLARTGSRLARYETLSLSQIGL
jgi:hypothetical protein